MPRNQTLLRARRTAARLAALTGAACVVVAIMNAGPVAASYRAASSTSAASYIYDADGRLLAVVEPGSDAYIYRYDPAGNILSVAHSRPGLSILRVSPVRARPGQVVHLFGTGFSANASGDLVTIGGRATRLGTVISRVQLDVRMPAGSAGGTVRISVGKARASSPLPLGLAQPPPAISSVIASSPLRPHTLIVAAGAKLTVTGSGFDTTPTDNRVTIGQEFASVISATPTKLVVKVPAGPAFSGALQITTPYGTTKGPDVYSVPFQVPGSAYPVAARVTSGQKVSVTLTSSQQAALLLIDGRRGQRLSVTVGKGTMSGALELFAPGENPLNVPTTPESAQSSFPFDATAGIVFVSTLPRNGTYMLAVNPSSAGTVPVTMNLFSDQVEPITANGGPVTVTVAKSGSRVLLPFTVSRPEQVSVQYSGVTLQDDNPGDFLYLTDRTGNAFGPQGTYMTSLEPGSSGVIVTTNELMPGPYDLVVDPSQSGDTGSVRLRLHAFADLTGAITPNGPPITTAITVPGQRALYTFTGTAGSTVSAQITGNTFPDDSLELIDPTGSEIAFTLLEGSSTFLAAQPLTLTGTYQLVVDTATSGDTGTATLQLYSFTDQTGTITPNGPPVTSTITVPGQRALYSFTGTAGSTVSAQITGNTFPGDSLELIDPTGSEIASTPLEGSSTFLAAQPLTLTGTYQLVVDPSSSGDTGTATLQLYSFTDQTGTITPNGPPVTSTITVPGQRALYSFAVTSPVNATVSWSGNTFPDDPLELIDPTGSVVNDADLSGTDGSLGPQAISAPGTYQVVVDSSQSGGTGKVTLQLATAPVAAGTARAAQSAPAKNAADRHLPGREPAAPRKVHRQAGTRPTHTATLSGVVLRADGQALPGVTLTVAGQTTTSNAVGRFTLKRLAPGRHLLRIDGATARPSGDWGFFSEVVNLVTNFPNQVPTPIWMTRIDNRHAVWLPLRITKPIVVTTPLIPGLELHIPAGTVIRNRDGSIVRKISITPIKVDRSPIPLPVDTPIPSYFTIQPGGATIEGRGVQLTYPNWGDQRPGTSMTFWSYGLRWNGWWVYGHGTVTPDGKHVVPDHGTYLHDFQGAMFNSGNPAPADGPGSEPGEGDPVDPSTGLFSFSRTDLTEPDVLPLSLTRSYRQSDPSVYRFGVGTNDLYGINLWSTSMAANQGWLNVALVLPNGRQIPYVRTTPDTNFSDAQFAETSVPGAFTGSVITWNGNGWDLALKNGLTYTFGEVAPLQSITDRYGNAVEVTYDNGQTDGGQITNVTSPNGRWIQFGYDSANCSDCVSSAVDNSGRTTGYTYDASQRLVQVTDVRGHAESYTYDSGNNMTTVTDRLGRTVLTNTYNPDNTVATQTRPGGGTVSFSYVKNSAGQVTSASFTDERGATRVMTFNALQEPLTDTLASATSLQRTTTYHYASGSGLLTEATDPLGRSTTYKYDGMGNLIAETQAAGTASARTMTWTYEPIFSRIASFADQLGKTTTASYTDTPGASVTTITDPTGRRAVIGSLNGNITSIIDGAGDRTTASYNSGVLASVTNPDHQTARQFIDSAGLVRSVTTPSGATTSLAYDPARHLTSVTDALGNVIKISYDAVGDPVSFTDADHHTTTYGYDALYRLIGKTDPLGAQQRFAYDTAGDLTSYTAKDGTIDNLSYDLLGQLTTIKWGETGSGAKDTTTCTYDAAGRLLTVSDTVDGKLTNSYDVFNNLLSQRQPSGTISYTYDADNRRTTMATAAGAKVAYSYDAAGRTTSIAIRGLKSALSYDAAGRLATVADPGVKQFYTYDGASNITKIATSGASPFTLGYTYDADNQEDGATASGGGLLAPTAVTSANYNADNELTALNGIALSYDANGALINDGRNTYTWNVRHQLTTITNGSGSTTIRNDAFGRPAAITAASVTRRYIYDGSRPAVAAAPAGTTSYAANVATGRILLETNPAGTVSLTADRLGSTTAVIDASGNALSRYAYSPFGASTITHASATSNDIGFAGYQQAIPTLDRTAARYYSPAFNRFISQDPAGIAAGQNLYAYAVNDPVDFSDPSGLDPASPTDDAVNHWWSYVETILADEAARLEGWGATANPYGGVIAPFAEMATPEFGEAMYSGVKGLAQESQTLNQVDTTLFGNPNQ